MYILKLVRWTHRSFWRCWLYPVWSLPFLTYKPFYLILWMLLESQTDKTNYLPATYALTNSIFLICLIFLKHSFSSWAFKYIILLMIDHWNLTYLFLKSLRKSSEIYYSNTVFILNLFVPVTSQAFLEIKSNLCYSNLLWTSIIYRKNYVHHT